ncbi:MAG: GNAT family N-acetyltransferase [Bacteroidia bacterium]|nr:GNAT family N-acetyltransferase [Bacteroidia bacterium]
MYNIKRTNSDDIDFQKLVKDLDKAMAIIDGEDHSFFAQFNKIDTIKHAIVICENGNAIGCGAIREYDVDTMEVKRMFVSVEKRGKGIASSLLNELESWAKELGYKKCILETSIKQVEAIALYTKNNYKVIKNYGQYSEVEDSVCFEKHLLDFKI